MLNSFFRLHFGIKIFETQFDLPLEFFRNLWKYSCLQKFNKTMNGDPKHERNHSKRNIRRKIATM